MAVKHTPTGIVHSGKKGGKTGCGIDTREKISHWVKTNEKITCDQNGCKNKKNNMKNNKKKNKLLIKTYELIVFVILLVVSSVATFVLEDKNCRIFQALAIGVFSSTIVAILIYVTTIIREREVLKQARKDILLNFIRDEIDYIHNINLELKFFEKHESNFVGIIRVIKNKPIFYKNIYELASEKTKDAITNINLKTNEIILELEEQPNEDQIQSFTSDLDELMLPLIACRNEIESRKLN
ncbi:MAG: hypothetical protein HN948_03010 [Clostridia bacterium]|nr:hypothetical protein [Clostridia bacterium]MBT7121962.1 hypothetical protein [Clostridia bacterium]